MKFLKKFFKDENLIIPKESICVVSVRMDRIKKIFPDLEVDLSDSGEYELWLLEEYGKIGFKLYDALTWVSDHKSFRTIKKYSDEKIFKMAKVYFNSKYILKLR